MSASRQLTVEQVLSRAKKAVKRGQSAIAVKLYNTVLQQQPNHPVARKGLRKLQRNLPHNLSTSKKSHDPSQEQVIYLSNLYKSGELTKTVQVCRKLLLSYPDSAIVLNILGVSLKSQGKSLEALKYFNNAIARHDNVAELYNNRGSAMKDIGRLQDAIEDYDKAIAIKPDHANAYCNRGNALSDLGELEGAIKDYDKAIEIHPDFTEAYSNRGNAQKDLGRLNNAIADYEKAIKLNPNFAEAYRNISALITYKPNHRYIVIMKDLYGSSKLDRSEHMHICFALAKVFEDLEEYDKSFNYLVEGNSIRKEDLDYRIDKDERLFATIKKIFAATDTVLINTLDMQISQKPIFIVGMPRSGTSLVEQILASHSMVYGAGEIETINSLSLQIIHDYNLHHEKSGLSYDDIEMLHHKYDTTLKDLNVNEKYIIDKMPINFMWIGFIKLAFPKAKFINLNRDAVATCWSIYKNYFSKKGTGYTCDLLDLAKFYHMYVDIMLFWKKQFSDSIYDLNYEELTENQENETRNLIKFCDLEWEESCLTFHETNRSVRTISATQVRKKMYKGSSSAWKKYEKHLQPLIQELGHS